MSLIDDKWFEPVFEPLKDKRVGCFTLPGRLGATMIGDAVDQLLGFFEIDHKKIQLESNHIQPAPDEFDAILISGGESVVHSTEGARDICQQFINTDLPVVLLASSFADRDLFALDFSHIYTSVSPSPTGQTKSTLTPDPACALEWINHDDGAQCEYGVFRSFPDHVWSLPAPDSICESLEDYFRLASKFEHILTDDIYFAITALTLGRRATLLPDATGLNKSFYDNWHHIISLQWRDHLDDMDDNRAVVGEALLTCVPRGLVADIAWPDVPVPVPCVEMTQENGAYVMKSQTGRKLLDCNAIANVIWEMCDGTNTVESMSLEIASHFPAQGLEVARDVIHGVQSFQMCGALAVYSKKPDPSVLKTTSELADGMGYANLQPATVSPFERPVQLLVNRPQTKGKYVLFTALLRTPSLGDLTIWYEVANENSDLVSRLADPFVLIAVYYALRHNRPLWIRGAAVSASLIENLSEFMRVWQAWRNDWYVATIFADELADEPNSNGPAILAVSGGVDSSYSIFKHLLQPVETGLRKLNSLLMVHGFDIPLSDPAGFTAAYQRLTNMLNGLDVTNLTTRTNARMLIPANEWPDAHGLGLASALSLFAKTHSTGLIASTLNYHLLNPLGSNPVTDHLLGSRHFKISPHGTNVSRLEKIKALAEWPEAINNLRVCWLNRNTDKNCGKCTKCLLVLASMKVLGIEPSCFDEYMSGEDLLGRLQNTHVGRLDIFDIQSILDEAKNQNLENGWLSWLQYTYGRENFTTS